MARKKDGGACRLCFNAAHLPSCNNVNNISAVLTALALGCYSSLTCQQRVIWPIRSWYQNLVSWMGGIKTKSTDSPTFFLSKAMLGLLRSPTIFVVPRQRFNDSLKIQKLQGVVWKTTQAWLDGIKSQELFFSYKSFYFWVAIANATFEIYGWNYRLPINFNKLFQLVLAKFFKSKMFSCLPKVDQVIN